MREHSKNSQVTHMRGVVKGGVKMAAKNSKNKINKEIKRLKELFVNMDKNKLKLAEKLIENAAFMSVTLDELKEYIREHGVKEAYCNGENQYGYKESIESKNYNTMIKNYMNIIKQLNDMMPETQKVNEDDEFDKFNDEV